MPRTLTRELRDEALNLLDRRGKILELARELSQLVAADVGDDLVWVQVFSPDLTLWERFNAEYVKHFQGDFPARAFLGSAPLLLNGRFEMMGIAVNRPSCMMLMSRMPGTR